MVHQKHAILMRELMSGFRVDRVRDHYSVRCILKGSGGVCFLNSLITDSTIVKFTLDDNASAVLLGDDVRTLVA